MKKLVEIRAAQTLIWAACLCFPAHVLGQGEADWWFFNRNVGLHFDPTANNPIPINQISTGLEDSTSTPTSISDPCGNFLFYASPDTIYDRNFVPMPNGGLGALDFRETETMIIPQPGTDNIYYVFYSLPISGPLSAYERLYATVDMNLNGGLGDVTAKNISLGNNASKFGAAALHENHRDIWTVFVDQGTNQIVANLLTDTGLQSAVFSSISPIAVSVPAIQGQMRFSPDGSRLAVALRENQTCFLYNFDPATGAVSSPINLGQVANPSTATSVIYETVEFSPFGGRLYRGAWDGAAGGPSELVQFNLGAGSALAIQNSGISVGVPFQAPFFATVGNYKNLQAGNDGRIYAIDNYVANTEVHRIASPGSPGPACNFQYGALDVGTTGADAPFRLPYFPWFMVRPNRFLSDGEPGPFQICPQDAITLKVEHKWRLDSVVWTVGIPGTGSFTELSDSTILQFPGPGLYEIQALVFRGCPDRADTVVGEVEVLAIPELEFPSDTAFCDGSNQVLDASFGNASTYLWQDGSTSATLPPTQAGLYWVEVSNLCGSARDSIQVAIHEDGTIDLGPSPLSLCEGEELSFSLDLDQATYVWEDGSQSPQRTLTESGLYWVEATNACRTIRDSVDLTVIPAPVADLGEDTAFCRGPLLVLAASAPDGTVLWNTGDLAPQITVVESGEYSVIAQNECSVLTDTVLVEIHEPPLVELGDDALRCENDPAVLDVEFPFASYLWEDGSTAPVRTISSSGTYSVGVTTLCGTVTDTIQLTFEEPPQLDLGPDLALCPGDQVFLAAPLIPQAVYQWNTGATTPGLSVTQPGQYQVSLEVGICVVNDSVLIEALATPSVSLGPDVTICEREEFILTAADVSAGGASQGTIEWPDGSSGPAYVFSEPGEYIVRVRNDCGEDSDSFVLEFRNCDCNVFVASAFSPNDDGSNDIFTPGVNCDFVSYQFRIYSRWGSQVFATNDPSQGWDGRNVPEGVYAWTVSYRWIGRGGVEVGEIKSGTVTLAR